MIRWILVHRLFQDLFSLLVTAKIQEQVSFTDRIDIIGWRFAGSSGINHGYGRSNAARSAAYVFSRKPGFAFGTPL